MRKSDKPYSVEMENITSMKAQNSTDQYSFSSAVEQLQNFDNFRSFTDAIVFYMKKHCISKIQETREFSCFEKMRKEAGVPEICSDRTWRNWKNGAWPNDRETAFKIIFALSLTSAEAKDFFQKAFFARPFDAKSIIDIVCYYCIEKNLPWKNVDQLRSIIDNKESDHDQPLNTLQNQNVDAFYIETDNTQFTHSAQASAELELATKEKLLKNATEDELINHCIKLKMFCQENHNKRLKVCAKKWLKKAKENCDLYCKTNELNKYMQLLTNGIESDIEQRNIKNTSSSSLLNNILGIKLYTYKNDIKTTKNDLKFMKKMIINQLPSPTILDQIENGDCNNPQFLRNTIILMSFYCLCTNKENDILKKINNELILSGTYPLYIGLPYDWMFIFSLYSRHLPPLDCFQALFDSAYDGEVKKIIKLNNTKKSANTNKNIYNDLTDEQKELFILARHGDNTAKENLAKSFLLKNEKQNPSLFEKVFAKFKSTNKSLYTSLTIEASFNEVYRSKEKINSTSYLRYNDNDFENIFVSICMKAIDSFEEDYQSQNDKAGQTKLTSWIFTKSYNTFQHPGDYEQYIKQPSYSEMWNDNDAETIRKKYVDKMSDHYKWIMEYRLGLTGPICSKFINLRNKMIEEHAIDVDRDDIISAERKFIRLITLSNTERSQIEE